MRIQEPLKRINYQAAIEVTIDVYFEENIEKAKTISTHYTALWEALYAFAKSGGKRIRPQMTLLAYEAFGGKGTSTMLPIAAAQELLHLSMLIHDDIIDRDYLRHGVDNIAGSYEKIYESLVQDSSERTHYAQSAALLAGDLLISGSYQLMMDTSIIPQKIIAIQKMLGESIFEVAGGELLDTEAAFRPAGEIDAETIAHFKTASYTFIGPLMTGALLAHASDADKTLLRIFADNLGIAYQFTDDIIGIFGNEEITGKSTIGDIREGKRTYIIEQFYDIASGEELTEFEKYFGQSDITREEASMVRELLRISGAKRKTEEAVDHHVENALIALAGLRIEDIHKEKLRDLVRTATKREL